MYAARSSSLVDEATLKDFYGLKTLQPGDFRTDTVPAKLQLDPSSVDLDTLPKETVYQLLGDGEAAGSGQQLGHGTSGSVVSTSSTSRKVKDPLGFQESVLDELIDKDVIDDSRDTKSAKYMIDSKSFNPTLFLSTLHGDKSARQLTQSIDYLERDLEQKKPLLQQLIASNFTRTLQTKNQLDQVFGEFSQSNVPENLDSLKSTLASSSSASNQLLNPILLHISKEREIEHALQAAKDSKTLLDLPSRLQQLIYAKDFYSIVSEFKRGKKFYESAKQRDPSNPLLDKIWAKVRSIVGEYKQSLWEQLGTIHIENISMNFGRGGFDNDSFLTLISRIMELGTDENPIMEFINLQYDYILKDLDDGLPKVQYARYLKSRDNLIQAYEGGDGSVLANGALKSLYGRLSDPNFDPSDVENDIDSFDLPLVIELWGFLSSYISEITDDVLSKKILRFAKIVQYFTEEFSGQTADGHQVQFEGYEKQRMRESVESLVAKVCQRLLFIFEATGDDLSKATDNNMEATRTKDTSLQSSFGFLPPYSNVVSVLTVTGDLQTKIIQTFQDLQKQSTLLASPSIDTAVEKTLKMINMNIITGVLATLNFDIQKLSYIENWDLSNNFEGCTKLPEFLETYYKQFMEKLGQLVVVSDPALLKRINSQFLQSFDMLVEKQLATVLEKSREDPAKKDFYFITSISNLSTLKLRVMPRIISRFDNAFGTTLSTQGQNGKPLKVYSSLEEYELILYREYLKSYKTSLKQIIGNGVRSTDWYQMELDRSSQKHANVSPFVLQAINFINTIKSRLLNMKANKNYILKVELDLDNYLITKLIDFLKEIRQFNTGGLMQLCIDLQFLCEIFRSLKESNQRNLRKEIDLDKLEDVASKFMQKNDSDQQFVDASVRENLLHNKAQMECFFGL